MRQALTQSAMAAFALVSTTIGALAMTPEDIKQGYRKHAALAQFHRWYQLYENGAVPVENALDALAPDVIVKSGLGEAKGHDAYKARVSQLPKTWKNAHFPRNITVTTKLDGSAVLKADLTYLNDGMKPGTVRSAELTYTMEFKADAAVLPKITNVGIAQNSEGVAAAFKDAYVDNRARSLMHYWLALIEDPSRNIEPFKEIFADGFALNFSTGKISDAASLEKWFRGPASAVAASTHVIENFKAEAVGPTEFKVSAEFEWEGILPNNAEMTARTRHSWLIVDNPKERFARIKSMDVEVLKPFAPKAK